MSFLVACYLYAVGAFVVYLYDVRTDPGCKPSVRGAYATLWPLIPVLSALFMLRRRA